MLASKLDLLLPKTHPSSSPSPSVSSLLFDPFSRSLALMLSDSSFLLYPSFSPFSSPFPSPTSIPPISTAACFLRLLPTPSADPGHVLFVSASPHAAGSAVLLRAWIRPPSAGLFYPARLTFKRDAAGAAVVLDLPHGFSVRISGSVNVLALHSPAANQIWVLAGKLKGDGDDCSVVFSKCAVVDCTLPIYSVELSMGFLMLGEVGGVRVFPLRPLVKGGKVEKSKGSRADRRMNGAQILRSAAVSAKKSLPNGVAIHARTSDLSSIAAAAAAASASCSGADVDRRIGDKASGSAAEELGDGERAPCKLRTVKLRQNSGDLGSYFVSIRCMEDHFSGSGSGSLTSLKAVSIHALGEKKFLILDTDGYLHLINLNNPIAALETNAKCTMTINGAYVKHFDHCMKVQMLAVSPDISTGKRVVWISDGCFSVHMMSPDDVGYLISANNDDEGKGKQMADKQVIFTSEKIQNIVPLSTDSLLIHGQGNIFVYALA